MLEELIMFGLSTLLGLGCFGTAAAVALNPETLDLDKIFSIIASVLLGLIFLAVSAWMMFNTRLRDLWKPAAAATPQTATEVSVKTDASAKKETAPQGAGRSAS